MSLSTCAGAMHVLVSLIMSLIIANFSLVCKSFGINNLNYVIYITEVWGHGNQGMAS